MRLACLIVVFCSLVSSSIALADHAIVLVDDPSVSPDGQSIVFSWRGDIWLVPIAGGNPTQLTTHPASDREPKVSPDGKQVAFESTRTGSSQIFVMEITGSAPLQLTFHSEGYDLQGWYPDGNSILALGSRDHFWRRSDRFLKVPAKPRSGETVLFDDYGAAGHLDPQGRRLLFTREGERYWRKGYVGSRASQIWLFNSEDASFRQVVQHPSGCRFPLWHPSGKSFYYVSGQTGSFNIFLRDLETGAEEQLTQFKDDSVNFTSISKDGSVIVFRHLFDLYKLDTMTRQVQKLDLVYNGDRPRKPTKRRTLRSATDVVFSPDALEIAFIAGGDVWVMDTELREPKQITRTAEEERELSFTTDGKSLVFVSDRDQQADIWKATRSDDSSYWWQNNEFTLKRITNDPVVEYGLTVSPDGKHLGYLRERGDFWITDLDGKEPRQIFASWNSPDYDWSPDGKWLVYAVDDASFNRDIYILPLDGTREPHNLSRHPDNDAAPVWSPDGKMIAFLGQRLGEEVDIYYVYLRAEDEEKSSRDRSLTKAIEKMKKMRKSAAPEKKPAEKPEKKPTKKPDEKSEKKAEPEKKKPESKPEAKKPDLPKVTIDFDGLEDRLHRISISNVSESSLLWSSDSKRLAFQATINGKNGTYTVSLPSSLSPKLLTSERGSRAQWLSKGNQIAWLASGTPALVSSSGSQTKYSFSVAQSVDVAKRYETAFMQCWRVMRDHFYDGNLNNRNWDAVYRKYASAAANAEDERMLSEVVHLMLGELNGSHLGFRSRGGSSAGSSDDWRETTAHFGLRFDPEHRGPGLKVRDVIYDSPADQEKTRILAGEIVLSINGKSVDPDLDMTSVLNGRSERDVVLQIRDSKGKDRKVTLRPISFGLARSRLYEHWIRQNQQAVSKASEGTFGYLHIQGMNMTSFYRFEQELFKVAAGKDGIIIDVRENGGGFTTDHLLTILTQPKHAITLPRGGTRGYPQDRMVYATWHKPVVVLCNQNSFSNAEIFSHAIKLLKRGRLVGVTTAGGVISTGGRSIMDIGFIRMPFRGWYLLESGEDMELHGAEPHFILWPEPTELPGGIDRQLDKAIEVLKEDVQAWKKRPAAELQKASEREGRK